MKKTNVGEKITEVMEDIQNVRREAIKKRHSKQGEMMGINKATVKERTKIKTEHEKGGMKVSYLRKEESYWRDGRMDGGMPALIRV